MTFPNDVKSFAAKTPGQTIAEGHVNDIQDEIELIEAKIIGCFARDGILDHNMAASPLTVLDQAFGNGATQITYNAANDRLEIVARNTDPVSGIYGVLPTALQFTPAPSARVELSVIFTVQSVDTFAEMYVYAGFLDHADPTNVMLAMRVNGTGGGAIGSIAAVIGGSGGVDTNGIVGGGVSVGTKYQAVITWQDMRLLDLTGALYNADTGAEVSAMDHEAITGATYKDTPMPDFGVWFNDDSGSGPMTVYIHDLYARVLRS